MSQESERKSPEPSKDPYADLKATPEFKAFEDATKRILKAPKKPIQKKRATPKPPPASGPS